MSSHIRYYVNVEGTQRVGKSALGLLADLTGSIKVIKTPQEFAAAVESLKVKYPRIMGFAFREPRKVDKARSRYKKLCAHYGLRQPKLMKVQVAPQPAATPHYWAAYDQIGGGLNGGTNQGVGLAVPPQGVGGGGFAPPIQVHVNDDDFGGGYFG